MAREHGDRRPRRARLRAAGRRSGRELSVGPRALPRSALSAAVRPASPSMPVRGHARPRSCSSTTRCTSPTSGLRLASDGRVGVLPEHDVVVFDEAHELEDVGGRVARRADRRLRSRATVARDRARLRARRHGAPERGSGRHGAPRGRAGSRARVPGVAPPPAPSTTSRRCPPVRRAGCALRSRRLPRASRARVTSATSSPVRRCAWPSALERCLDADPDETVVWSERERDRRATVRGARDGRPGAARRAVGSNRQRRPVLRDAGDRGRSGVRPAPSRNRRRARAAAAVAVRRRRAGAPVPPVRCTRPARAGVRARGRRARRAAVRGEPRAGRSACSRATARSIACTSWRRRGCAASRYCDRARRPASGCWSASGRMSTRCSSRPRASGRGWMCPARHARWS